MNHDLVTVLVELYKNEPKDSPDLAAMRVAVLVERCLRNMESSGKTVSRESMLEEIKKTIKDQKQVA